MDWYYREESGLQVGPLTDSEFEDHVKMGRIVSETLVWNESLSGWRPYNALGAGSLKIAEPVEPMATCSQCFRQFPQSDVIRYQDSWVCASCKPVFFQRLKEGGVLPGVLNYAEFWPRVGAKLIDGLIQTLGIWLIAAAIIIPAEMAIDNEAVKGVLILLVYGLMLAAAVGYNVYFLTKYGATPGKMMLGMKVVTAEGDPITAGKAVGRFFAEFLSQWTCYIGYIMAAFDEERRALHDRLCNTRVIRK
jgi:uncharacterized RDD family membrane protein YckC